MNNAGRVNEKLKNEVAGITLLALGLLLSFCFLCPAAGLATGWISTVSGALLGYGRYFLPAWLLIKGYNRLWGRNRVGSVRQLAGGMLLFLVVQAAWHLLLFTGQEWPAALQGRGGGIIGAAIVLTGKWAFGLPGLAICLLAMALIGGKLYWSNGEQAGWRHVYLYGGTLGQRVWQKITAYLFEEEESLNKGESLLAKVNGRETLTVSQDRMAKIVVDAEMSGNNSEQGSLYRLARGKLPPLTLLRRPEKRTAAGAREIANRSRLLQETMKSFGLPVKVVSVSCGPAITRYEIVPPPGVKISRIVALADDLALSLAAPGVRIEVPVPGKACLGIEVPNDQQSIVYLRELLEEDGFWQSPSLLTVALGRDIAGEPVFVDLAGLPHLLLAGATGAGKSVCLNSIVASLLFRATGEQLRFVVMDPKKVDLAVFRDLPHLVFPVITSVRQATQALGWVMQEMERRYKLFAVQGVRQIMRYNQLVRERDGDMGECLPYIVVVIDELADLMLTAPGDIERGICRLAQMGRAAGIHLIIATQRPSVDVITGLIKANIPARIAFAVSSQVDSRTILEQAGAEKLLGKGDMLFLPGGSSRPVRVQGAYISDEELTGLVDFWRRTGRSDTAQGGKDDEEMLERAINLVTSTGQASVSLLQRRLQIGYTRAVRLLEAMENMGIVGSSGNGRQRMVLVRQAGLEQAGAGLEEGSGLENVPE